MDSKFSGKKGIEQVLKEAKDIAAEVDDEIEPLMIGNFFTGSNRETSILQECPI